ncbi:MAG: hypothetical protein GC192_03525 [Bacteroidetes bacterium]|nr:hypothetical protein [Bacteroidota bacterium]
MKKMIHSVLGKSILLKTPKAEHCQFISQLLRSANESPTQLHSLNFKNLNIQAELPSHLEACLGVYDYLLPGELPCSIQVARFGTGLRVILKGSIPLELRQMATDEYQSDILNRRFAFIRSKDGSVSGMVVESILRFEEHININAPKIH